MPHLGTLCSHSSGTIVHFDALNPLPQRPWREADTWSQSARSKSFRLFLESPQYHLVPEIVRLLSVLLEDGHFPEHAVQYGDEGLEPLHLLDFN